MPSRWKLLGAFALFAAACSAHAAGVQSVSPQGEAAQVRQVVVTFTGPEVPFGDPRLPDPFSIACTGSTPGGAGRWSTDRTWLFDFAQAVPAGTRCTLKARPEWKPLSGALAGKTEFTFSTGGPAVLSVQPYDGAQIEEEQHFILRLSGAATEASVVANARCEVEGIGERLPVRVVGGPLR